MSEAETLIAEMGAKARAAAAELAFAAPEAKRVALEAAADAMWAGRAGILSENRADLDHGREKGLSPAMMVLVWLPPWWRVWPSMASRPAWSTTAPATFSSCAA